MANIVKSTIQSIWGSERNAAMTKTNKFDPEQPRLNVFVRSPTRFECEFLGYSIFINKRKSGKFVILVVSDNEEVVVARSKDFNNLEEAITYTVKTIFS